MSHYIVTGGAGFIGSCLVRRLLGEPNSTVEVIDNLQTGHLENLDEVSSRIRFHQKDIRDYNSIRPILQTGAVVFHLAAIPSVPKSIDAPVPSHEVNIDGTFQLLRAAADAKVKRVVYAASSSAYGDTEELPKTESMAPRPKSPYAVQKLLGEYYCSVFTSCFGLETLALRFFNVYGPRQDPGSPYSGVLSLFMKAILERKPPTIFGDGEQSRDFTNVEDVATLCVKAAFAAGVTGRTFNAGNGNRYSLNRVWSVLQQITGVRMAPLYGPPRPGDVRDSQADITAAVRELGHAPQVSLEEGLARTFEWYRDRHVRMKPAAEA